MAEYIKFNDTTIHVTKTETKEEVRTYDLDFLKEQEANIIAQKKRDNEARDKELEEVQTLIAECEKLNIKTSSELAI